jgi:TldD protein
MATTARPAAGTAFFAEAFGIDAATCDGLLGLALSRGGDFADLFFEHSTRRSLMLEDGRVRSGQGSIEHGLGIRVVIGEAVGYASTERLDLESMRATARRAAGIAAHGGQAATVEPVRIIPVADRSPGAARSIDEPPEAALTLLRRADAAARAVAPSITNVFGRVAEHVRRTAVATSDGRLIADVQPMVLLVVSPSSVRGADRQAAFNAIGFRGGLEAFAGDERSPDVIGRRAAERAILLHDAVEAPAGVLPVVLAPGDAGIFLHEAVGHGLEADFNRKRQSAFTDRVGQRVASPRCTVVDDGTIPGLFGSLNVDDEGELAARNVLIEKGILRGYLQDRVSARYFGRPPSGSGRRQDFRHTPMPRMTTTFMLAGDDDPEDIVRAVRFGVYCRSFGNGQVDIANGDYVFSTEEAYLIEDGRITAPIRTTNLIGNGPDSMARVTMVGGDLRIGEMAGMCGKGWQSVPVSMGMPTTLVDGITLGGTRA